jgi:hypothetical protein
MKFACLILIIKLIEPQMVETHQSIEWPANASAYKLVIPIGMGSFGLVWKAEV